MTVHCYAGYKNDILTSRKTSTVTKMFSWQVQMCVIHRPVEVNYICFMLYWVHYNCLTIFRIVFIFDKYIFYWFDVGSINKEKRCMLFNI